MEKQLNRFEAFPLDPTLHRKYWIIQTVYVQQLAMFEQRTHTFTEGSSLKAYVENNRQPFGFYLAKVLVDKIYCSRENRKWLKDNGIKLAAKPLGRPLSKAVENHASPGERNPIEGKFGQAKTVYGMNRIKARLKDTSQSWVAAIILVFNLVKLAGEALFFLSFSAWATFNYALIAVVNVVLQKFQQTKNQFRLNSGPVLRTWNLQFLRRTLINHVIINPKLCVL